MNYANGWISRNSLSGLQGAEAAKARGMSQPVRCRCGEIYCLQRVHVTAHHADCSVWKTSCCGRISDSRNVSGLDFTVITRD